MIVAPFEVVEVQALGADVGDWSHSARVNDLLSSEAGDLCQANTLDFTWKVIDSNSDIAVKTRSRDGQELAALGVALVVADRIDGWHDSHVVASGAIKLAGINRACVVHGVACASKLSRDISC